MTRALLILAALLAFAPSSRAAAQFRTGLDSAIAGNIPAGTHFWCVFPEFPSRWTVILYEKLGGPFDSTYQELTEVTKNSGAPPRLLNQMMTVPPHARRECLLIAFRNDVQEPYRGYTPNNPLGWHTFGSLPPVQALVVQIPPGASPADIATYQRIIRRQWTGAAR
jgi:hypothetical protein